MELYLIRHTTVAIEKGICYGLTDVDVAETFHKETQEISNQISIIKFDDIWCSPAIRCTKLARTLFSDIEIKTDERLLELNFGDWEGLTWNEIFQLPEGKNWMNNFVNNVCPNGESFQDQINRVQQFYTQNILSQNADKIALVVHAGIIRSFQCLLQGVNPIKAFDEQIDYGAIVKINISDLK